MDTERELLKGNTPTLVMAVLRDGPLHGYAIAREIEHRSGNALRCKEGTIYPALHALESKGLIAGEWQKEEGGRERKVYALTAEGHRGLQERARVWSRFTQGMQCVLQGGTDGEPRRSPGIAQPGRGPEPEPAA